MKKKAHFFIKSPIILKRSNRAKNHKYKEARPLNSQLMFLNDNQIIKENGTIPGNTIAFSPPVGEQETSHPYKSGTAGSRVLGIGEFSR
ncbi:MAG TPA: hypothetical protein VK205_18165 [Prolixibacteraceae bacterium]|nr:hypothetical protein [Prolixibacteraceae bacterium]